MVLVLPALRQLQVEEGHVQRVLGRDAPSEAGLTAQKASFHRHWLPHNPTAHLASGWDQEGPSSDHHARIPWAVEQPPPSMQCLSAALPELFAHFLFTG